MTAREALHVPLTASIPKVAWLLIAGIILCLALGADLCVGRELLDPYQALRTLLFPRDDVAAVLIWDLRLPRALLGVLCGASLAVAGAMMQGVVGNELAVPELTGVTGGASFTIVASNLWWGVPQIWLPALGFLGGVLAAALTLLIAWNGSLQPIRLTLAGLAVAALAIASVKAVLILAGPEAESLLFWLVGGLAGRSWPEVMLILPWVSIGLLMAIGSTRALDLLQLGDDRAQALGVRVLQRRLIIIGAAIILTAATVSVAGPIAFIGLAVPHVARLAVGQHHRWLLPSSALLGASLLTTADLVTRLIGGATELPVGVLTAIIGGPILLRLVSRERA